MSQFIQTSDKLMGWKTLHVQLVQGVFSRILGSGAPKILKETSNQRYFQKNFFDKVLLEQKDAAIIHNQTMINNYHKIRDNLSLYARSKSHKVEKIFQQTSRQSDERQQSEEIKKVTVKLKKDRVIFIDRKYNKQLVMKTAALSELQNLQKFREKNRRAQSTHQSTPLLDRFNRERLTVNLLESRKISGNPLLRVRKKTLGKKRKQHLFNK